MKRFLVLLLILTLCLSGCKKQPADIPGGEEAPEGVDWQVWNLYMPATLNMGKESVEVLIALDEIHLAIYYDRQEQELLDSFTILTPLSDVTYSREHLRILDQNGDGYDDLCVPDMLQSGDRAMEWWLWDPEGDTYRYAPELSELQQQIGADVSWQTGKAFDYGIWDTPEGPEDLLVWVEADTIHIYLDARQEQPLAQVQIPEPLSREARSVLTDGRYWECWDVNGDGWGDLQLPYRWEQGSDGSVYQYQYVWLWQTDTGNFLLDRARSGEPAI